MTKKSNQSETTTRPPTLAELQRRLAEVKQQIEVLTAEQASLAGQMVIARLREEKDRENRREQFFKDNPRMAQLRIEGEALVRKLTSARNAAIDRSDLERRLKELGKAMGPLIRGDVQELEAVDIAALERCLGLATPRSAVRPVEEYAMSQGGDS